MQYQGQELNKQSEGWEERFDAKWEDDKYNRWYSCDQCQGLSNIEQVKSFISSLIEAAKQEERDRADRLIRETKDSMELETNAEFIACDDLAIKFIKALARLSPDSKEGSNNNVTK